VVKFLIDSIRKFRSGLVLFLALHASIGLGTISICNRGPDTVTVAIAHYSDASREYASEGWWVIAPSDCALVSPRRVNRSFFFYAYSENGSSWGGDSQFCVSERIFLFRQADSVCPTQRWRGFRQQFTNQVDVSINLDSRNY
jgi:uncharacterized membrane protein